jgi:hypothetical protein
VAQTNKQTKGQVVYINSSQQHIGLPSPPLPFPSPPLPSPSPSPPLPSPSPLLPLPFPSPPPQMKLCLGKETLQLHKACLSLSTLPGRESQHDNMPQWDVLRSRWRKRLSKFSTGRFSYPRSSPRCLCARERQGMHSFLSFAVCVAKVDMGLRTWVRGTTLLFYWYF